MANRFKGIGITISHNKDAPQIVLPSDPSPAISKRFDRFDTGSNEWSQKSDMNEARCGFSLHSSYDFIYAIGGTDGSQIHKSVEEYDILSDTWEIKAEMTTARCFFASVELDGYIYCIGGMTSDVSGTTAPSRKLEKYDTINNTWTTLSDLPSGYAIMFNVAHVVDEKIYVLSGFKNNFSDYLDSVLVYDIANDSWTVQDQLPTLELALFRRLLPFSFIENNYIYVVNGLYYDVPEPITNEDGVIIRTPDPIIQYLPDAYKYDITSGIVYRAEQDFSELPRGRYSGTTSSIGNTHYFLGGVSNISNTLRFFETIDVSSSPFGYEDLATQITRGRSSHAAASYIGDYGDAIFVGGGLISKQDENYLRVEVDAVPAKIRLDGKQSANIRINVLDENNEAPNEVKVRLTASDNTILFTSDEVIAKDGYALATIIPRCDDGDDSITMNDSIVRSYSVNISGSIIDANYYGDTIPDADQPPTNSGGTTSENGNKPAKVTLPSQYVTTKFDTVESPEQNSQGNYFSTNLTNIGGFLSLRPTVSGGNKNANLEFFSDIHWLPRVTPILDSNDATYEDMRDALDRISREMPFGGSPFWDALYESAEIMSFDVSGVKKITYLATDGNENCSHRTVDEVLNEINALDGIGNTPVVSSQIQIIPSDLFLNQGIRSGSPELEYIAKETQAESIYVASDSDVSESIRQLLKAKGFVGYGVFTFEYDFGEETLIESIRLNFSIPDADTDARWRYTVGNDARKFRILTDQIEPNETITLTDVHGRFLKFVVEFSALLDPETYLAEKIVPPRLTTVEIVYHKKSESYIYLNSTNTDSEVQQVVFTLDATRPSGSEILVGANDEKTGTWEDYGSPSTPPVENNSRIVIPTRRSLDGSTQTLEKLNSIDGFIFETTYGKWSQEATVIIYKDGETVIPETDYRTIPQKGRVIFASRTEDDYVISIENKSQISTAVKVINRVNGSPIQVYGAGYMFSTNGEKKNTGNGKIFPVATNVMIIPIKPDRDSVFKANYTYNDLLGRPEKPSNKSGTIITWYVNNTIQDDIQNLELWDNKSYKLVQSGDVVYFTVEPATVNGTAILLGPKVRSLPLTVA